jgi:hypothetical protein
VQKSLVILTYSRYDQILPIHFFRGKILKNKLFLTLAVSVAAFVAVTIATELAPNRRFASDRFAAKDTPRHYVKYFCDALVSRASY